MVMKKAKIDHCYVIMSILVGIIFILTIVMAEPLLFTNQLIHKPNNRPDRYKPPKTLSVEDFINFSNFSYGHTNQTIAYFMELNNFNIKKIYFLNFFYKHDIKNGSNWYITIKTHTNGVYFFKGHLTTKCTDSKITLIDLNLLLITIYPSNNTSTFILHKGNFSLHFEFKGLPFWYNNGQIISINKKWHIAGFEILGNATGKINGEKINGFGTLEKISFNIPLRNTPYFENWCAFFTNMIKGITYRQGGYQDGGVWIFGRYYPSIDFITTELNYSASSHYIYRMSEVISVNISGNVGYLYMHMQYICKLNSLILMKIAIIYNGESYKGYSIIDNAFII